MVVFNLHPYLIYWQVEVRIESVDVDAGKMSLSMKPAESLGLFHREFLPGKSGATSDGYLSSTYH